MKTRILLFTLFLLANTTLKAQSLNHAYQPSMLSFASELLVVDDNRFLIGGQIGAFMGYPSFSPYLRMVDANGATLWQENVNNITGTELGEVLSLQVTEEGNILAAGVVMGCDYGLPGFIAEYDTLGNQLSITEVWEMFKFCQLPDGSLGVLSTYGVVKQFDPAEGVVWETNLWMPGELFESKDIIFGPDNHLYILGEDQLVKMDLDGNIVDQFGLVGGQALIADTNTDHILVLTSSRLFKLDTDLNSLDELALGNEGSFQQMLIEGTDFYLLGRTPSERPMVAKVSDNLTIDQSFTLLDPHFIFYDFEIANNKLVYVGDELPDPYDSEQEVNVYNRTLAHRGSNIFLYSTGLDGTPTALNDDAAILDVNYQDLQLDTIGQCGITGNDAGTATWSNVKIIVQNQGSTTLESVTLNTAFTPCSFICPTRANFRRTFENLLLAPGESVVLDWGTLQVQGIPFDELTELCFWTSLPNGQMDGDHTNNLACADITIDTRDVVQNPEYLILSPNPVNDQLRIQLMDNEVLPESYRMVDLTGKTILENTWPNGQDILEVTVEGYPTGVYLMQINTRSQALIQQFVITGD